MGDWFEGVPRSKSFLENGIVSAQSLSIQLLCGTIRVMRDIEVITLEGEVIPGISSILFQTRYDLSQSLYEAVNPLPMLGRIAPFDPLQDASPACLIVPFESHSALPVACITGPES